jgi:hypothetical protein
MTATATQLTLSRDTLEVLKNFASINSNLLVSAGNKLTTISPVKNVMAEATVSETFDSEFGLWDLNKFLGVISLFKNPTFNFTDKYVIIEENGASVKYYFSDPSLLSTVKKQIKMPEAVISFDWKPSVFSEMTKAASVLQLPDLCIRNSATGIEAVVIDKADPSSNSYSVELQNVTYNSSAEFEMFFKVENLKLMSGEYTVNITEKVVSQFEHKTKNLRYWIALEADSSYSS